MNLRTNKYFSLGVIAFLVYVACVLFKKFIDSYEIPNIFSSVIDVLMPFIIGFAIAYLLNPIMDFFEKKVVSKLFAKVKSKRKKNIIRGISVALTLIIAVSAVVALMFALIPQVIVSIMGIINNLPEYVSDIYKFLNSLVKDNEQISDFINEQFKDVNSYIQNLNMILPSLKSLASGIVSGLMSFIGGLVNFFVGLVVSIYVLFAKEKFISQCKKVIVAITPKKISIGLIRIAKDTHTLFGKYFSGQIIDAIIVGVITGIGMIFIFPKYALLIGVVTGIFNIIPFFGPFISAVPCGLLILLESPTKCIIFVIFIVAVQQFDGNILCPRILGGQVGMSAFWIMLALLTFSAIFGFIGMFIGVPIFAVIYTWISRYINSRLDKKGMSTETKDYLYMNTKNIKEYDPKQKQSAEE